MADQIPIENRQLVQGRAFGRCERCLKATLCGHHHHRRPKGIGGSRLPDRHDVANLVWLDAQCHRWVHDHPADSAESGFIVPRSSGRHPLEVPITDLAGQTRFLDNLGQYLTEPAEVPSV